jgi:peptide/nickel transport system substrate-binding protein
VPPGSQGHLDFGEQFPYDPEKALALLKEVGYDAQNPLRYTLMTYSAEASLPIIRTVMKTQLAKIGVEVEVEVLDRPIYLRCITRDWDWDQMLVNVAAAIDPHTISHGIDTRVGNNTINHEDTHVDALIDHMRETATEEEYLQAGYDFQRYVVQNMLTTSVSSYAHLQAARSYVKGYENLHGYKLRFETTWMDK